MYEYIQSSSNPKIKLIKELYTPKGRKKNKLFIAEGRQEIEKAFFTNHLPIFIFINKKFIQKHLKSFFSKYDLYIKNAKIFEIEESLFSRLSYRDRSEGILAIFHWQEKKLEDIILKDITTIIVLEKIEKPGNLGAILRIADATKTDAILVTDTNFDIYNPNVIRASTGCIFTTNVILLDNFTAYEWLKKNNFFIYATKIDAKIPYTKESYRNFSAFVFGSENKGISDFWKTHNDVSIYIPMLGKADSLNVATSVALLLYENLRQKNFFNLH